MKPFNIGDRVVVLRVISNSVAHVWAEVIGFVAGDPHQLVLRTNPHSTSFTAYRDRVGLTYAEAYHAYRRCMDHGPRAVLDNWAAECGFLDPSDVTDDAHLEIPE